MPKVKRDKFSVFNFLSVIDGTVPTSSPSSAPPAPAAAPGASSKRSRWDVAEQGSQVKDPVSIFISEARSEVATGQQDQASTAPPAGSAEPKTDEPVTEQTAKKNENDEEEEEEEVRPPMDLFKAIFASSSDKKSSSSSEEDSEPKPISEKEDVNGASAASPVEPGNLDSEEFGP